MATPHIEAKEGDFAKIVLMPGDPKRAEWIANTFLKDVKLVNAVRGILGFTGKAPDGSLVSVMASGMGMPSIGIYSHELFTNYGVEAIIRIGTIGAYQENIKLKDILIGQGACTNSNWMGEYDLKGGTFSAISDYDMLSWAVDSARKNSFPAHIGNILSSDVFYGSNPEIWKKWQSLGVLGVEMEAYALYATAAKLHKKALAICTVSDSFCFKQILTSQERQEGLDNMVKVALDVAMKFNACHTK